MERILIYAALTVLPALLGRVRRRWLAGLLAGVGAIGMWTVNTLNTAFLSSRASSAPPAPDLWEALWLAYSGYASAAGWTGIFLLAVLLVLYAREIPARMEHPRHLTVCAAMAALPLSGVIFGLFHTNELCDLAVRAGLYGAFEALLLRLPEAISGRGKPG